MQNKICEAYFSAWTCREREEGKLQMRKSLGEVSVGGKQAVSIRLGEHCCDFWGNIWNRVSSKWFEVENWFDFVVDLLEVLNIASTFSSYNQQFLVQILVHRYIHYAASGFGADVYIHIAIVDRSPYTNRAMEPKIPSARVGQNARLSCWETDNNPYHWLL